MTREEVTQELLDEFRALAVVGLATSGVEAVDVEASLQLLGERDFDLASGFEVLVHET